MAGVLAERDGLIWFDGEMVPWREATVHVLSHGLHYGTGVFEGIRAYKSDKNVFVFRLREHIERLFNSAHIFGMPIPHSCEAMINASKQVISENNLDACYIRPIVFYGAETLGLSLVNKNAVVHAAIAAWPWGTYLGDDALEKGIRVKTSSFSRHQVNSVMCRAKICGHYVNSVMANSEVAKDGYDEALLLDSNGFVSEGAGENIFLVKDGKLFTPSLTSVLEGITRNSVVVLAQDLGMPIVERLITRDDVYCADEAFFVGTAAEVTPIREVDGRGIGSGSRGDVTKRIQEAYFDCVRGKNSKHKDWISVV